MHLITIEKICMLSYSSYKFWFKYRIKWKYFHFKQDFYLILNVAVGGDFLAGPDPWDEFYYPQAEMWIDWVKMYKYEGGEVASLQFQVIAN